MDKTINQTQFDAVITRHQDLISLLLKRNLINSNTPQYEHVDNLELIKNKNVIGVIPAKLAVFANSITVVDLAIPKERKGLDLPLEELEAYAGETMQFKVEQIPTRTDFSEAVVWTYAATLLQHLVRNEIIPRGGPQHQYAVAQQFNVDDIVDKPVIGHISYFAGCKAKDITSYENRYSFDLRGKIHTPELMQEWAGNLFTYKVKEIT